MPLGEKLNATECIVSFNQNFEVMAKEQRCL